MATFDTLSTTTESNSDDSVVLRQGSIDYKQTRESLAAGIANARWIATADYDIGSEVIASDGNKYYALVTTGISTTAVDPTTDDGSYWQLVNRNLSISELTEKTTIVDADQFLIADSEDSDAKKRVTALKLVKSTDAVIANGQDWDGVAYTDPDAVGANPTAKIYPDGSIVGSTDNGSYVKHPNGVLTCSYSQDDFIYTTVSLGNVYRADDEIFTYPHEFISTPDGAVSMAGGANSWASCNGGISTSSILVRLMGAQSSSYGRMSYVVTGRWK